MRTNDAFEHELLTGWIEGAGVGLCALDAMDSVVVLNRTACKFLDVQPDAVMNATVSDLLKTAANASGALVWMKSDKSDSEFLLEIHDSDQRRFYQLKKSSVTASDGQCYQVLSFSDVSALLLAREKIDMQAFQESKRREWQALNAGLVISDALQPDMPMVYVNAAFERMSGYSSHEMLGRNCRFLQGGEDQQPGLEAIRNAIANKTSGYAVLRNYRKDGSSFLNELFISPIRDAAGTVTQYIGVQHLRNDDFL